jgi:hypothetical protein
MTAQMTTIIIKSTAYNAELGGDRGALADRADTPESCAVSIGDTRVSFGLMENGEIFL